jgi:hypothetical protein
MIGRSDTQDQALDRREAARSCLPAESPDHELGDFQFKLENGSQGDIYGQLAGHQRTADWDCRHLITQLQDWTRIFEEEFNLDVPEVTLGVDYLRCTRLGHFRRGHNGFGLKGEIVLNRLHLGRDRVDIDSLGTLLHEQLHGWEQDHGKPGKWGYHTVAFIRKAGSLGLIVDHRGHTSYAPDSPFTRLLQKHGIIIPPLGEPVVFTRQVGESKLKKWSCGCTNARVAVADFRARCLKCGELFQRVDP